MDDMTTKEAIAYVAEYFGLKSYYALSKALSDETLTVQPIQISNYAKGGKMSKKVADRFFETFGIVISDAYKPGALENVDFETTPE